MPRDTVARRERQGSRDLRARRRAPAARRQRSHLDLRRRPADRDPGQGSRADGPLRVLVRADEAHRPEPLARAARRRSLDGVPAAGDAARRMRRPRLHHRLGLEGLPAKRRGVRAPASGRAARVGAAARADLHAVDEGSDRPRREHHARRGSRARRRASVRQGRADRARAVRLCGGARGGARHHPRRHEVRARRRRRGRLVLADEAFTPDSSRFWPADATSRAGRSRRSTSSTSATTASPSAGTRRIPGRSCRTTS